MPEANDLERALAAALADPVRWMDFYRCLRDSQVLFGDVGDPSDLDEQRTRGLAMSRSSRTITLFLS